MLSPRRASLGLLCASLSAVACSSTTTTTTATSTSTATTTTTATATSTGTTTSTSTSTGGARTSGSTGGGSTGAGSTGGGSTGAASFDGGTRFPSTSIIYQDVSASALDPNSDAIIGTLSDAGGWGTGKGNFQTDFSLVTLYADSSVPALPFTQSDGYESPDCDVTPVPLPPGGSAEGTADYNCTAGDCHILVYQGHWLYEMWEGNTPSGLWDGGLSTICEVAWDLTHDYWQEGTPYSRGDQCTSADAAGMPIAPLLVTGAELQAGVIQHAMRFTLPNTRMQKGLYLHPGTHSGAPSASSPFPIYGSRFRLKPTFDMSQLSNPAALAIAVALQTYGMFLDDGGNIPLTIDASASAYLGSHDLDPIQVSDFEVVASPDAAIPSTDKCTRTPLTSTN
jgi:serine/threonine-protein kinase